MKKLIIILTALVLSACGGTAYVKNPFPNPPQNLMVPPEKLVTLLTDEQLAKLSVDDQKPSDVMLSTVAETITKNYTLAHKLREQIFGLQQWISEQKRLNP